MRTILISLALAILLLGGFITGVYIVNTTPEEPQAHYVSHGTYDNVSVYFRNYYHTNQLRLVFNDSTINATSECHTTYSINETHSACASQQLQWRDFPQETQPDLLLNHSTTAAEFSIQGKQTNGEWESIERLTVNETIREYVRETADR